jgi:hypothetical protein
LQRINIPIALALVAVTLFLGVDLSAAESNHKEIQVNRVYFIGLKRIYKKPVSSELVLQVPPPLEILGLRPDNQPSGP